MATNAIARVEHPTQTYALKSPVADILTKDEARALIEPMLRPGDSFDRVIVEVYHAAQKNADILKCTSASIVNAVSRAVRSGLVIGEGVHLVPYGQTLQEIYDYKGRIQLICMAGAARAIDAQCVYEHEHFVYEQGTSPSISHRPIMNPAQRGKMIGAYAVADQGRRVAPKFVVLSVDEIEKVRQTYSKTHKRGELPYWYAQKTCVHRLAKLLPKNPELAKVVAMFDAEEAGLESIGNGEPEPTPYALSDGTKTLAIGAAPSSDPARAPESSSSADDALPWEAAPPSAQSAPAQQACEAFAIPNGLGPRSGQTLGSLSTADAEQLYAWAKRQADGKYPGLTENCEELLEGRRLGDLREPSPDDVAAFKAAGREG